MGIVEVDETYIGGKEQKSPLEQEAERRGTWLAKTPVIGAISRKGNVVCKMIENADTPTLHRFVAQDRQGQG